MSDRGAQICPEYFTVYNNINEDLLRHFTTNIESVNSSNHIERLLRTSMAEHIPRGQPPRDARSSDADLKGYLLPNTHAQ